MENSNLKELSSNLIQKQKKVIATVTIVDDGEASTALVSGECGILVNMLASAMIEQPQFRQLIGKAYLAATVHTMKS